MARRDRKEIECLVDTGAGFFATSTDSEIIASVTSGKGKTNEPRPTIADNLEAGEALPLCLECECDMIESFLMDNYGICVCNNCRKTLDPKYKLITRTGAKQQYLLKDCDFDERDPPLKYILRRNPHKPQSSLASNVSRGQKYVASGMGDMKLYVEMHVRDRAIEVWGDLNKIEEEREKRSEKARASHNKKFKQQLRDMRKAVQGDGQQPVKKGRVNHVHDFKPTSKEGVSKCDGCGQTISVEHF